jgi:hypothetical protein
MPYQHGLDRQGEIGTYLEGPLKGQTPVAVLISAKETVWLKIVGRDVAKLDAAKGASDNAASKQLGGIIFMGLDVLPDMGLDFARFEAADWRFVYRHVAGVLCLCDWN